MPVTLDIRDDHRYKQGLEAGRLEASHEIAIDFATKLLKKGISVDDIKDITKLTEQEIKELAQSLKSDS